MLDVVNLGSYGEVVWSKVTAVEHVQTENVEQSKCIVMLDNAGVQLRVGFPELEEVLHRMKWGAKYGTVVVVGRFFLVLDKISHVLFSEGKVVIRLGLYRLPFDTTELVEDFRKKWEKFRDGKWTVDEGGNRI